MNENKIESIVKKQFEESTSTDDYNQLWLELEPRLPRKKRFVPFLLVLFGCIIGSLSVIVSINYSSNSVIQNTVSVYDGNYHDVINIDTNSKSIDLAHFPKPITIKKPYLSKHINEKSQDNVNVVTSSSSSSSSSSELTDDSRHTNRNIPEPLMEINGTLLLVNEIKDDELTSDFSNNEIKDLINLSEISSKNFNLNIDNFPIALSLPKFIINKANQRKNVLIHVHLGEPIASYKYLINDNAFQKFTRQNLEFSRAFQIGIEVPLKRTDYFDLGLRLSYLNIEERFEFRGEHTFAKDSINQDAFLVNGISSIAAEQSYSETLEINALQRNQFEVIKISPVFTFKTKGSTIFGLTLMPELSVYQNYNGVLLDSDYTFKNSGDIVNNRKFNDWNWTSELFIEKRFSESIFGRFSFQYSSFRMDNELENIDGLNGVKILSIGAGLRHKF